MARPAAALDKQGSAHAGTVGGNDTGFDVSGALSLGLSPINRSYAARPDNTGLALMRYAAHADVDLLGRFLSVPLDVNLFSDRQRGGLSSLSPTELDLIAGLTTTWTFRPGSFELGSRVEHDRPVDRGGQKQTYVDTRARYLYSVAQALPELASRFPGTDLSGWLTLGWFTYNRSYFARPDNTGRAFLRYAAHVELSLLDDLVSLGLDATMFTDRTAPSRLRPSEVDLTPELIFHRGAFELHLAFESDAPLDRGGLVQRYVYALAIWNFSPFQPTKTQPFENRGQILSP